MIAAIHGILEQGFVNRAARFNGVDTGTTTKSAIGHTLNTLTTNFHLKVRVKLNGTGSCYIISTGSPCLIYGFVAGKFEFFTQGIASGTNPRTPLTTAVTDTNWHTVEWIYDGTTLTGKLDGAVDVTKTVTFVLNPPGNLAIGKYASSVTGLLKGDLDWVKIGKDGSDIHHWDMNEESPTYFYDSIGDMDLQTIGSIEKVTV